MILRNELNCEDVIKKFHNDFLMLAFFSTVNHRMLKYITTLSRKNSRDENKAPHIENTVIYNMSLAAKSRRRDTWRGVCRQREVTHQTAGAVLIKSHK